MDNLNNKIKQIQSKSHTTLKAFVSLWHQKHQGIADDIQSLQSAIKQLSAQQQQDQTQQSERHKQQLDQLSEQASQFNHQLTNQQQAQKQNNAAFVGQIAYFAATKAPEGWLALEGQSIARKDYPALWAFAQASGNLASSESAKNKGQFGPGRGSSQFSLPDLRSEFIRTADNSRRVGTSQSEELGRHTHSGSTRSAGNHKHTPTISSNGAHSHSGTTASAGKHKHGISISKGGYHSHSGSTSADGGHFHFTGVNRFGSHGGGHWIYSAAINERGNQTHSIVTSTNGHHSHNINIHNAGSHSHGASSNTQGSHKHSFSTNSTGAHSHDISLSYGGSHYHSFDTGNAGGSETRPRNIALLACIKY